MNHPISHQTTHKPRGTERQTRPDLPPAPTVNVARKRSKPDQISHTRTGSGEAKSTRKCRHRLTKTQYQTASQIAGDREREPSGWARGRLLLRSFISKETIPTTTTRSESPPTASDPEARTRTRTCLSEGRGSGGARGSDAGHKGR